MMSFALMGCLIIGASDASAQGRSRSQGGSTNRSQSAAVSRSNNNSHAPSVTRNSGSSVSRSAATPRVDRSASSSSSRATAPQVTRSSSSTSMTRSTATPRVDRSATSSNSSSRATSPQVTRSTSSRPSGDSGIRSNRGATTRGNDKGTSATGSTRRSDSGMAGNTVKATKSDRTGNINPGSNLDDRHSGNRPGGNGRPNGNKGGIDKPSGNHGGNGRPNGNHHGDKGGIDKPSTLKPGHDRHDGNRPGGHRPGGHKGGHNGYSPNNRYSYHDHHYRNEFSWNYKHHSWSRPLPPPVRVHRPAAPWAWYRPMIPAGWHPYAGAPIIDRVLGLVFGSLYEASLDHLYYSGYFIDGYADGIIFLRDVPMLNLYWPDVMLNYDANRLVNAQFVYYSDHYDTSRYNAVARSLSRLYGPPVLRDGMTISWYGGDSRGYVTLSMVNSYGDYYTTMSIGY